MTKQELLNLAASSIAAAQAVADAIGALPDDPVEPPPAPTATITVSPLTIEDSHDGTHSATVSWITTGADTVTVNGQPQTFVGSMAIVGPAIGQHTFALVASGPGGTAQASATLTVVEHSHPPDPGTPPHPDDPIKQAEHLAAMALVTAESASLFVPAGQTTELTGDVTHDGVRFEGTLRILGTLRVETLLGTSTSRLEMGDGAKIVIRDTGPITDPFRLGRGIISHGQVALDGSWTIESENPALDRRGHFMVMHSPKARIVGGTVRNLGRTDKSQPVTDPDGQGGGTANPRGRYPLHIHRTGSTEAVVIQNVRVEGSPGWGIVNHDSWVECDDCTCVDTFGAAFVGEIGTERGHFRNWRAEDIGGLPLGDIGISTEAVEDWGKAGHAVWLQGGGGIEVGPGSYANLSHRAVIIMGHQPIPVPLSVLDDEFAQLKALPQATIPSNGIPNRVRGVTFDGGLLGMALEPWVNQEPFSHTAERGYITDCIFNQCGILSVYSNRTDYIRNKLTGNPLAPVGFGMHHTGFTIDHTYQDNEVKGFGIGIFCPSDGANRISGGRLANVVDILVVNQPWPRNPRPGNPGRDIVIEGVTFDPIEVDAEQFTPSFNGPGIPPGRWNVALCMFFSYSDIRHTWNPNRATEPPPGHPNHWSEWFHWRNTFGPHNTCTLNGEHLSYLEWGWDYPVPAFVPAEYRLKPDGSTKTQGELYTERGWCPCGRVPVQGERRPNIWALVSPGPAVLVASPPIPQ